jgi:hypothetical protein
MEHAERCATNRALDWGLPRLPHTPPGTILERTRSRFARDLASLAMCVPLVKTSPGTDPDFLDDLHASRPAVGTLPPARIPRLWSLVLCLPAQLPPILLLSDLGSALCSALHTSPRLVSILGLFDLSFSLSETSPLSTDPCTPSRTIPRRLLEWTARLELFRHDCAHTFRGRVRGIFGGYLPASHTAFGVSVQFAG